MNLYARIYLRRWFTSNWPNRDLDLHCDILSAIIQSIDQGLLTKGDVNHTLRYLAGYEDNRAHEESIIRTLLVWSTLLGLDDATYARRILFEKGITDNQTIDTAIAKMSAVSLWVNHENESDNI